MSLEHIIYKSSIREGASEKPRVGERTVRSGRSGLFVATRARLTRSDVLSVLPHMARCLQGLEPAGCVCVCVLQHGLKERERTRKGGFAGPSRFPKDPHFSSYFKTIGFRNNKIIQTDFFHNFYFEQVSRK